MDEPGDEDDREQDHDTQREPQAEFLGDDGEDEVRVRLREIAELLPALSQPDAIGAAGGERGERLVKLVGAALAVALDVEEGGEPAQAVRVVNHHDRKDHDDPADAGQDVAPLGPGEEEERQSDGDDEGGRAEVGFEHDEAGVGEHDGDGKNEAPAQLADARLVDREVMREAEDHGELGEFRNLQAEGTEAEPAAAALHLDADVRDRDQQKQQRGEPGQPRHVTADVVEIEPAGDVAEPGGQEDAEQLLVQVVIRPLLVRRARAEEDGEPENGEADGADGDDRRRVEHEPRWRVVGGRYVGHRIKAACSGRLPPP